jgi:curli biogenesis system outer membrane secretion channel CsgG
LELDMMPRLSLGVLMLLTTTVLVGSAPPLRTGILPFDVVSIDGATDTTGVALAKLVRIEMIKGQKLTPVLLTLPDGAATPVPAEQAASIGQTATVGLVLVGTVVDASVTTSSHSANTGGLLGSASISGTLNRSTATVSLHIDLVDPATGKIADSFDVAAKATDTGVGTDFSTSLGEMNLGDDANSDKTPMAKALREAAKKVSDEVGKRAAKFAR